MARESAWIVARSIPPVAAGRRAVDHEDVLFKFPIARVDDINVLRTDFDMSEAYNAEKASASFARITDPVRSAYLAEGYDYEAMVRNFEHDAVGLFEKNSARENSTSTCRPIRSCNGWRCGTLSGDAEDRV